MTIARFTQLWEAFVPKKIDSPSIVMGGSSEKLIDALVKVADGDHSAFEEIERRLSKE